MPRLSLYRPQKSQDYRFFDRTIKEMFTVGATDLYVHKYVGITNQGPSDDITQPQYTQPDPLEIQDLLFLENRDRKYDPDIYRLRGHYNVQNLDFDLSQFGLFLSNDTIFITVHYNDMIDVLGRKLMVGDVLELPHLTDYHPLNDKIPTSLRRYYQVTDGNFASEGFSQTWYPHLWRIKCEPLVNSQEFANILDQPINKDNYLGDYDPTKTYFIPKGQTYTITYAGKIWEITGGDTVYPDILPPNNVGTRVPINQYPGQLQGNWDPLREYPVGESVLYNGVYYVNYGPNPIGPTEVRPDRVDSGWTVNPWKPSTEQNLIDILSTYNKNLEINQAVIDEAKRILPQSGYDNSPFYIVPTFTNNVPAPPVDIITVGNSVGPNPTINSSSVLAKICGISNPAFQRASMAIRISAAALENINNMILNAGSDMTIDQFIGMSLRAAEIAPEKTDTGSGAMSGDLVLTARALGAISSPYGTADNTYATADAYLSFIVTAIGTGATSTVIQLDETSDLQDLFPQYSVGCLLSAQVVSQDGTIVSPFAPNTRIAAVDLVLRTITIDTPLLYDIPGGTGITVNPDFNKTLQVQNAAAIVPNPITGLRSRSITLVTPLTAEQLLYAAGLELDFPVDLFPTPTYIDSVTATEITFSNIPNDNIPANTTFRFKSVGISQQMDWRADCDPRFQFIRRGSPRSFGYVAGYLTGTTEAPNGEPTGSGVSFPANPQIGDYFLRIDYNPQKLFRWDGAVWIEISSDVRTATGFGVDDRSQLSSFINNNNRVALTGGGTVPSRQSLSKAFLIRPD